MSFSHDLFQKFSFPNTMFFRFDVVLNDAQLQREFFTAGRTEKLSCGHNELIIRKFLRPLRCIDRLGIMASLTSTTLLFLWGG